MQGASSAPGMTHCAVNEEVWTIVANPKSHFSPLPAHPFPSWAAEMGTRAPRVDFDPESQMRGKFKAPAESYLCRSWGGQEELGWGLLSGVTQSAHQGGTGI